MAESSERPNGRVARRRRERRMRSWFRHEQQSIRMALATVLHHSHDRVHTEYGAPRSQNTATRARRGEESDEKKSSREHAGEGVFRTFPRVKKSPKLGSHSGSELLPESSPSTLSAPLLATDERTSMVDANGHAWVRLDTARGTFWQNLDTGHQQWRPPWEH